MTRTVEEVNRYVLIPFCFLRMNAIKFEYSCKVILVSFIHCYYKYSQTCMQRPLLGTKKVTVVNKWSLFKAIYVVFKHKWNVVNTKWKLKTLMNVRFKLSKCSESNSNERIVIMERRCIEWRGSQWLNWEKNFSICLAKGILLRVESTSRTVVLNTFVCREFLQVWRQIIPFGSCSTCLHKTVVLL